MARHSAAIGAALLSAACAGGTATQAPSPAAPRPAAAAPAATTLRYAAGTSRYRVVTEQQLQQEVMGNVTELSSTTTMVLTVTASSEGGNLSVAFTLDSVSFESSLPGVGAGSGLEALRGRTFTGTFEPSGRLVGMPNPDTTNPAVTQMIGELKDFFPVLPTESVVAGASWSDTTSETVPAGPLQMRLRATRNHRVVGWDTTGGSRALRMATTTSYSMEGSGEQEGQMLSIAGSGTGQLEHLVGAGGSFVSRTARDSAQMTVTVVSMGLDVPVRRTSRTTITRLP